MSNLSIGLEMMVYGMGTTFSILILFYLIIKGLTKLFPEK